MKKVTKSRWIIALCLILFAGIISACKSETDDHSRQAEEAITLYSLKTGSVINDIFKNTEKLNAIEATAFAKSTEPPASATYYLDTDESCIPVWYDSASKTIYYYAPENRKLILNADSSSMFYGMYKLNRIDTSGFDTSNVTDMNSMFCNCGSLSLDVSGFDTANVTNMNGMFALCESLSSLDVSGFDTAKVTDMAGMFAFCSSLSSLDVSSFDTSNVTRMSSMFSNCSSLTTISVTSDTDWSTSGALTNSGWMFYGCTRLVGGKGTTYDSTKEDATYACVDGLNGKPGYFTVKPASQE